MCVVQGCIRHQEMDQDISITDSNSCYDNLLSEEAPLRASVCVGDLGRISLHGPHGLFSYTLFVFAALKIKYSI